MATALLSNVFNDPSNPWYYVIGVLFLVLIFAALGVYIYFSGKNKKKDNNDAPVDDVNKDTTAVEAPTEETEVKTEESKNEQEPIEENK